MTYRRVAAVFAAAGAACAGFLAQSHREPAEIERFGPATVASVESEGNPDARVRYEWLRLHDPVTGKIPDRIREKETAFAAGLPVRPLNKADGAATTTWVSRGPVNVGGRTRAFGVDLDNPNVLLAGGVSGGMWRSTDAGITWTRVTLSSQLYSVSCMVQDPRPGRRNVWYYGTGELIGNSTALPGTAFRGDGIYKSTDDGQTWNVLPATSTNVPQSFDQMFDYVHRIAVDPHAAGDVVYAATIGGIERSTDGGATWSLALGGGISSGSRYTDVAVTSTGVVYATLSENNVNNNPGVNPHGIMRSTDGVTWTNITPASFAPAPRRMVIGVAPSNENIVYILGETPGSGFITTYAGSTEANSLWKYTYASGDGTGSGGAWEDRSLSLPSFGGSVGSFASQGGYDLVVLPSPAADSILFIGGTNLYRSMDGFRTGTKTTWIGGYATANDVSMYGGHHPDQHLARFLPGSSSILYSTHDGGISVTSNALASTVVWNSLDHAYVTGQFYTIALDHATAGSPVLVGGLQDNGTWISVNATGAAPWTSLLGGDGAFCAVADGASATYASAQQGQIYRVQVRQQDGQPLSYTRVDPGGASQNYLFVHPFALDPADTRIMYLPYGASLQRNSDLTGITTGSSGPATKNWTSLTGVKTGSQVSAVGVSRSAPSHRLYLGTTTGGVFRLDHADTASSGTAAVDIGTGKGLPSGAYVSCIAVDPQNGARALLVFSSYSVNSIFQTTDAGITWTPVGGNLEQFPDGSGNGPSVRWASILPLGAGAIYFAGTSTGLYSTTILNAGATIWTREGAGTIGDAVVDMIDVRAADGVVAVSTHGAGVFSSVVATGAAASTGSAAPVAFALEQNYPNPFNPATTVSFSLDQPSDVRLAVFDLQGREVASLLAGPEGAGRHEVRWTPRNLASGTYLCRLEARAADAGPTGGSRVAIRKIIYLK